MNEIISKIVPIILLIILGWFLRYKEIFKQESIDEIKKFIINFALSSVLFITFFNMEIKKEYYLFFSIVFIMLYIFFIIGFALNKIKYLSHPILPFTITGCTIALLGLPLFGSVFGIENINNIAIFTVGHEFFIWLVFYPYIGIKFANEKISFSSIVGILKTPTMISIILGMVFNIIGFKSIIEANQLLKGIYITVEYLASLSTPLILIIIGYGLKLDPKYMKQSTIIIIMRLMVMLGVGYIFKIFIVNSIIAPNKIFDYAYFTFLILPSPLVLPLFIGINSTKENEELANNTLVLNTLVSIIIYIVFTLLI